MNNVEVAKRFVNYRGGQGSNFRSEVLAPDKTVLYSYRTLVAAHIEDRLFITTARHSPTTDRHIRHVETEWGYIRGNKYFVENVEEGGSAANVRHYLKAAMKSLEALCAPRIRMPTRIAHWAGYLRCMGIADEIMALLAYGSPVTPEFMANEYERANAARVGANPTGLAGFDNDMLLRVKAIAALEG
jgi:hypothetical protein